MTRERRPEPISGWKENRRAARAIAAHIAGQSHSVWSRRGVFMVSALELAELPDGSGESGPQWHVSISRWEKREATRASDAECSQALACLGLAAAEEDNHEPGVARHFWVPVDPARRRDCECKDSEKTIVEPDGHRWTTPKDETHCHGCDYEVMVRSLGVEKPCPIHGSGSCQMMVGGSSPADATPCGTVPTVGGNGLYRYCDHHMRVVAAAGATTLAWDSGG